MNSYYDNRFSKISFFIIFIMTILVSLWMVLPFILAIIIGALFAAILHPVQEKLIAKTGRPMLSAYIISISFIIITFVPLFFFIQKIVIETSKLIKVISSSDISLNSITDNLMRLPILKYFISDSSFLNTQLKSFVNHLVELASNLILPLASQIPSFIFDTIFILLSLIVFLINGEKIKKYIFNLIPLNENIKKGIMISFNEISKSAFLASLLAAIGQTTTMLIGFLILDIPNTFLATCATFIFSFIPIIGTLPIWIGATIYLYLHGSVLNIIIMMMFGIATGLADNLIRTYILNKSKNNLHPFLGFISVVGGIQLFGMIGLFIGPIFIILLLYMCSAWPSVLKS